MKASMDASSQPGEHGFTALSLHLRACLKQRGTNRQLLYMWNFSKIKEELHMKQKLCILCTLLKNYKISFLYLEAHHWHHNLRRLRISWIIVKNVQNIAFINNLRNACLLKSYVILSFSDNFLLSKEDW